MSTSFDACGGVRISLANIRVKVHTRLPFPFLEIIVRICASIYKTHLDCYNSTVENYLEKDIVTDQDSRVNE